VSNFVEFVEICRIFDKSRHDTTNFDVEPHSTNNSFGYGFIRFLQKTWLARFDGFCANLGMMMSLLYNSKTCLPTKTKVAQLVKIKSSFRYSLIRFLQKTCFTRFDGFRTNLGVTTSFLLIGKLVYRQRQKVFSVSSPTTLLVTALYAVYRRPNLFDLKISAQILVWQYLCS
jgi:hypothetical protein